MTPSSFGDMDEGRPNFFDGEILEPHHGQDFNCEPHPSWKDTTLRRPFPTQIYPYLPHITMADNGPKTGPAPSDRTVIGITFGNSNSSIAYTVDDKAEVIANEDGGEHA